MTSLYKRFYINSRYLTQPTTGVQRFATELVKGLGMLLGDDTNAMTAMAPMHRSRGSELGNVPLHRVGRLSGHLWEQLQLPWYSRDGILVNLCNVAPIVVRNQVVVIHDVAVFAAPGGFSRPFLAWYRFLLPLLCRRARMIVTVSEFSKSELVRYCGANPEKVFVIPNGTDHIDRIEPAANVMEKFHLKSKNFVLSVGSLHPNKNLKVIVQLAERVANRGVEFVVTGGSNSKVFAASGLVSKNVRWLGSVSDAELKGLYSNAACFLFPSRYEGFGIPPLEAMRCGCPVVVSSAASLPEVCGDAALYAPPDDVDAFEKQLSSVLNDGLLRMEMSERGRNHSAHYQWSESSKQFHSLLSKMQDDLVKFVHD